MAVSAPAPGLLNAPLRRSPVRPALRTVAESMARRGDRWLRDELDDVERLIRLDPFRQRPSG
jgi:hypothetical protein